MTTSKKTLLEALAISERLIRDTMFMCRSRVKSTYFTRKDCKMGFRDMILFQLNLIKKSLQIELDSFFELVHGGEKRITKQAYSEARRKISPTAFIELDNATLDWFYGDGDFDTFLGYRLLAMDATVVELPDTKRLRDAFGYASGAPGVQLARAKAAGLYDVRNDLVVASIIGKYTTGERDLAKNLIARLKRTDVQPEPVRDLILFDRGYGSALFYWYLENSGVKYLIRVKTGAQGDKQFRAAQKPDQVIDYRVSDGKVIKMRVVRFPLESGEEEVLVTNLLDDDLSLDEFKKLYFMRWGIETKFNELKNRLEVQNFSGETVIAVEQDFYASIYLSNMIALAKKEANEVIEERNKDKDLKNEQKVNTNILIGKLKDRLILMMLEQDPDKRAAMYQKVMKEISDNVIPIRPGRTNPRKKGLSANKHHRNQKRSF